MKNFETYDDIINESKELLKDVEQKYGLKFSGTKKGNYGEYYQVKESGIVEISFNTGRFKDEEHQFSWHPRLPEVADYDAETKSWTVIMTEEQFKELYYKRFGKRVRAEFFNDGRTWGVRITLTAKKAVRTMWQLNRRDLPDQVFILRETKNQLFWTDDIDRGIVWVDRKADAIGKELFETEKEATEALLVTITRDLSALRSNLRNIQANIEYLTALKAKVEADSR